MYINNIPKDLKKNGDSYLEMIDFNQEHPFENAIGEYLLYNRGKQSKSKWKLDAKQPFEEEI